MGTTNSNKQRTVGATALRTEIEWGGQYFMLLTTGKHIHRYIWTDISISEQVIQRVGELAKKVKKPDITKGYPIFDWSSVTLIMDHADSEP